MWYVTTNYKISAQRLQKLKKIQYYLNIKRYLHSNDVYNGEAANDKGNQKYYHKEWVGPGGSVGTFIWYKVGQQWDLSINST